MEEGGGAAPCWKREKVISRAQVLTSFLLTTGHSPAAQHRVDDVGLT